MLSIVVNDNNITALDVLKDGITLNLVEDGAVVGVAYLQFEECFILQSLEVFDNDSNKADFFFRSILFKLGSTAQRLKVKADSRLCKFGFVRRGDYMEVECKDAIYPSNCKH